jgi:hypothetical protein
MEEKKNVEITISVPIPDEVLDLAKKLKIPEIKAIDAYMMQVEGMLLYELDFQEEELVDYTTEYLEDEYESL